jgi:hypothetical protein
MMLHPSPECEETCPESQSKSVTDHRQGSDLTILHIFNGFSMKWYMHMAQTLITLKIIFFKSPRSHLYLSLLFAVPSMSRQFCGLPKTFRQMQAGVDTWCLFFTHTASCSIDCFHFALLLNNICASRVYNYFPSVPSDGHLAQFQSITSHTEATMYPHHSA